MKGSIFIIDDDDDVREVLAFALESEGFNVLAFENGKKALDALKETSTEQYPGFIIVDYLMPEMDGVTFIQEVKKVFPETIGKIPIALSSAKGNSEENPVNLPPEILYLSKPMELDDLLQLVHENCLR